MSRPGRVLVVDDEFEVRSMLADYLTRNGFEAVCAEDAAAARARLEESAYDALLIDVSMPGENGFSLARHVREHYDSGVLMVTASDDVVDRVVGLEIGADDYVVKPFDLRELLARVRSVLRRTKAVTEARASAAVRPSPAGATRGGADGGRVAFGRCQLDLDARKLFDQDGQEVPVTAMELDLLALFASRPNRVLTRDQILDAAHNRSSEPFDRSIDSRIARLRKKIEINPAKPQVIKTIRAVGYIYVPS